MTEFLSKFRIPTLLGLGIIIFGIAAGSYLVFRGQNITSNASSDTAVQNVTVSNFTDDSVTISWQTSTPTPSFITLGIQSPNEITILDDRDNNPPAGGPKDRLLHYATMKNLLPKTTYQYKIISGKFLSDTSNFTTAAPLNLQTGLRPVIGSVVAGDKPVDEAIAYLSITGATTQSAVIKNSGNFLIPISQIRKADLSEGFSLSEGNVAKLTILSPKGQATVLFNLGSFDKGLPPVTLGENLDLTSLNPKSDQIDYDLNGDGRINSADNAIILQNLGKNPKNPKADLNKDEVVDQKDLDLLIKQIH